jgi:hypothetical protein
VTLGVLALIGFAVLYHFKLRHIIQARRERKDADASSTSTSQMTASVDFGSHLGAGLFQPNMSPRSSGIYGATLGERSDDSPMVDPKDRKMRRKGSNNALAFHPDGDSAENGEDPNANINAMLTTFHMRRSSSSSSVLNPGKDLYEEIHRDSSQHPEFERRKSLMNLHDQVHHSTIFAPRPLENDDEHTPLTSPTAPVAPFVEPHFQFPDPPTQTYQDSTTYNNDNHHAVAVAHNDHHAVSFEDPTPIVAATAYAVASPRGEADQNQYEPHEHVASEEHGDADPFHPDNNL